MGYNPQFDQSKKSLINETAETKWVRQLLVE
jgi:hypothetical protein